LSLKRNRIAKNEMVDWKKMLRLLEAFIYNYLISLLAEVGVFVSKRIEV